MAHSFNGTSSYYEINTAAVDLAFTNTSQFSVALWAKHNGSDAQDTLIGNLDTGTGFKGWELSKQDVNNGNWIMFFVINTFPTNAIQVTSDFKPSASIWYHYIATYDGSSSANGVKIYVNGIKRTNTNLQNSLSSAANSAVKIRMATRHDGSDSFAGSLSDVAIWSTTLSPSEAFALGKGLLRPHQIRSQYVRAWWPMGGPTAAKSITEFDHAGYGHIAQPSATTPTFTSDPSYLLLQPSMPDYYYDSLNPPMLTDYWKKLNIAAGVTEFYGQQLFRVQQGRLWA